MNRQGPPCVQKALVEQAQPIVDYLCSRGLSVVSAESCTAGLVAAVLSHARGAGQCLHGGFITYSKEHKASALDVDLGVLRTAGSVNADVARQMAQGALRHSVANLAIAVTGVLGPDPDPDHAPPGLVYISAARRDREPLVVRRQFEREGPDEVRQCAIEEALKTLLAVARQDN